jgi:hypothetical protein
MSTTTIDLSAGTTLNLTLRAATAGALTVTVTQGGVAANLTGATIKYHAALSTPITKTVGSGITLTTPASGIFTLAFTAADTATQNSNQQVEHECKITLSGGAIAMLWEGMLTLEQTMILTTTA